MAIGIGQGIIEQTNPSSTYQNAYQVEGI